MAEHIAPRQNMSNLRRNAKAVPVGGRSGIRWID